MIFELPRREHVIQIFSNLSCFRIADGLQSTANSGQTEMRPPGRPDPQKKCRTIALTSTFGQTLFPNTSRLSNGPSNWHLRRTQSWPRHLQFDENRCSRADTLYNVVQQVEVGLPLSGVCWIAGHRRSSVVVVVGYVHTASLERFTVSAGSVNNSVATLAYELYAVCKVFKAERTSPFFHRAFGSGECAVGVLPVMFIPGFDLHYCERY